MCVFWQRGYEATSLEDLLAAMDISKSSFYQAFGSKSELFQRCLENYRDASTDRLRTMLDQAASGKAFLESILNGIADGTKDPMGRAGCLLMNTANEFAQRDPRIAALVTKSLERMEDLFYAAICRAQAEGDIPKKADARSLALFLIANLGGLRLMTRAGASPEKIRTVGKVVLNGLK
jgi:TetR/AcrR family transcriptional repressor of nem operon